MPDMTQLSVICLLCVFLSLVLAILLVFNVNRLHATLAVNCAESINAFVCKYDTSLRIMLEIVVAIVIMNDTKCH